MLGLELFLISRGSQHNRQIISCHKTCSALVPGDTEAATKAKSKTLPSADMDAGHSRDSCSVLEGSGSLRIF